jgi:hypothetical protein
MAQPFALTEVSSAALSDSEALKAGFPGAHQGIGCRLSRFWFIHDGIRNEAQRKIGLIRWPQVLCAVMPLDRSDLRRL